MTVVPAELIDEEAQAQSGWDGLLARLSNLSVTKHFDAYADVDWDGPEMRIDRHDPRWALDGNDPLGATDWYRDLPLETQASLGLDLVASKMKIGLQFESILKQGLLRFAAELPNRSPEFRYCYHELIEEAHHSLMFQEFVNRSGFDARGLSKVDRAGASFVVGLARRFPELFFVFVLGGEDPIDHVQRRELRRGGTIHPLLERIMRIHVTEEARHLSFARHYLEHEVPRLGPGRRRALSLVAPVLLGVMARQMLSTTSRFARANGVPQPVARQANRSEEARAMVRRSVAKIRRLCGKVGLLDPMAVTVWRAMGI
ncbi:MAG TPA: diiron oxygenase, partial [Acidimicrobiales bacterium]|nr:diiron oxygenase [Acidimicrobiales bacterium]